MKLRFNAATHFILFIIFAVVFFWIFDKLFLEDSIVLIALGLFIIVAGIWGNKANIIFLRIPLIISYKITNYIIIVAGAVLTIIGLSILIL